MAVTESANIRRTLTRRCAALGIPVSGTFELTPRCNLQCKMCYVRLTPEQMKPIGRELTAEEWLQIAQDAKDAGMAFLLITGGEPTLREDFCEIYGELAQMGFSISINTNGTRITPQLQKVWAAWPPAQVNVTLYGTCAEDYRKLCGNPAAYDAVVSGLDWLQKQGILVRLNATMTPNNRNRWQEIENFARNRNLELRMTTYCFPPLRRGGCIHCRDDFRLPPEEAAELMLQDILYREGPASIRRKAANLNTRDAGDCSLDTGEPMQCMAGKSQFWVAWNGEMHPCGMLVKPTAPLLNGNMAFTDAWEAIKKETEQIRLCPDCVNCPDQTTCLNCAAVTYTETGCFDGKPEYMCQLNRAYRSKLLELAAIDQNNP